MCGFGGPLLTGTSPLHSPSGTWGLVGAGAAGRLGPALWGSLEEVVGLFLPALFDLVVRAPEGHLGVLDDWVCSGWTGKGLGEAQVVSVRTTPGRVRARWGVAGCLCDRGLCAGVGEGVTVRHVCGSQALG